MKSYKFIASMKCVGIGYVAANSLEEAKKKILNEEYYDIYDMADHKVVDVINVEETGKEIEEDW